MKTLLILTDFSRTSDTAAAYACELSRQLGFEKIILYHSYQVIMPASEVPVIVDEEQIRLTSLQQLEELVSELKQKNPAATFVCRADTLALNDIDTVALEENASMIVMGTTGKSKLEEVLFGSNAISVCQATDMPVILVPAQTKIQPVGKIIFACDMIEVEKTIPLEKLKSILDAFKVPLTVLNVDDDDKHFTADTPINSERLHDMLNEYNPQYYNINKSNVAEGIIEFVKSYPATMVLLIARRHNFMEGIFFSSLTRTLNRKALFPLLVIRGNKI